MESKAKIDRSLRKSDSEDAHVRLVLDLVGPFVVHSCLNMVKIHAPQCTAHHANILTDSNDVSLLGISPPPSNVNNGGFVYTLTGPTAGQNYLYPDNLLVVDKPIESPKGKNCHLILEAPIPEKMVCLVPEQIWIQRNGAGHWLHNAPQSDIVNGPYARGLRFIYSDCPTPPKITLGGTPKSFPSGSQSVTALDRCRGELDCLHFEALGFDPKQYHATLRFADFNTTNDDSHQDAYNCFQSMRALIEDSCTWRVDFDDLFNDSNKKSIGKKSNPLTLLQHGGAHPVDCAAAILVTTAK